MGTAANVIVGPATMSVGGVDVGFTKDGIKIRNEREYVDVAADQLVGLVKKAKSMEKMFVSTTLLETTSANLQRAWDQDGQGTFGSIVEHEVAIVVVGKKPGGGSRTFTMSRAVSIGESEVNFSREEEAALTVEFECLKSDLGVFGTVA